MCAQGKNSYAKTCSGSDKCFADTAGNSDRSAGFQVEDTEGADHTNDGTEQAQQRLAAAGIEIPFPQRVVHLRQA